MSSLAKSVLRSRTFAFVVGFAASVLAVVPFTPAKAQDLVVKYDQSQLLRLPRPVAEIIIGNPTVAEVTVQASNLLVVTGKTFGITNVIALDAERNIIQDQRVVVVRDDNKVVSLHKGSKRETYNCTPSCNPSMMIGDDSAYFNTVVANARNKMTFTEGSSKGQGEGN